MTGRRIGWVIGIGLLTVLWWLVHQPEGSPHDPLRESQPMRAGTPREATPKRESVSRPAASAAAPSAAATVADARHVAAAPGRAVVAGKVVDGIGGPVPGARVAALAASDLELLAETVSSPSGDFSLQVAAGPLRLEAES
jgi:hypothetical protein